MSCRLIEYLCVKCCNCGMHQAQQRTKTNKWACRTCNTKQSIVRVLGVSNVAKDIREQVMSLNRQMGNQDRPRDPSPPPQNSLSGSTAALNDDNYNEEDEDAHTKTPVVDDRDGRTTQSEPVAAPIVTTGVSKWAQFMEDPESSDSDDGDCLCPVAAPLQSPTPKKRRVRGDANKRGREEHSAEEKQEENPPPAQAEPPTRSSTKKPQQAPTSLLPLKRPQAPTHTTSTKANPNTATNSSFKAHSTASSNTNNAGKKPISPTAYPTTAQTPNQWEPSTTNAASAPTVTKPHSTTRVPSLPPTSKWAKFQEEPSSDDDDDDNE